MMRRGVFWAVAVAVAASACHGRRPVLAPPPEEVEAVEGYGHAAIEGEEGSLRGRFSFLFRAPDRGRVEALDPLGRTAYFVIIRDDAAFFVVPSKRAYAVDEPDTLAGRLLGFPFKPGEAVSLLCDRWTGPGSEGWTFVTDSGGRTVQGRRDGLSFDVRDFFRKAGIPRAIGFSDGPVSGLIKVLSVRFNPLPRPDAFETGFTRVFVRMSWEELQEFLRNED
jgi:hypothetical protein